MSLQSNNMEEDIKMFQIYSMPIFMFYTYKQRNKQIRKMGSATVFFLISLQPASQRSQESDHIVSLIIKASWLEEIWFYCRGKY